MNHTKGPWKIVDQTNSGDGLNIKDANGIHVAHTAVYASQLDKIHQVTWTKAHANALLIATAPEMLEALIAVYELFDTEPVDLAIAGEILHRIIAKAKGESDGK